MNRPSAVHVIRLRDPWERIHENAENASQSAEPKSSATIRFQRRFGMPTNLNAGDRVDLILQDITKPGSVMLNGELLGRFGPSASGVRFSIRDRLQFRNVLQIEFQHSGEADFEKLAGSVRLEIQLSQHD